MGCYSWKFGNTKNRSRLVCGNAAYLLIPEKFGGGHYFEPHYDGYGQFAGKDVFELIADWNREVLSEYPGWLLEGNVDEQRMDPKHILPVTVSGFSWYKDYADLLLSREQVVENNQDNEMFKAFGFEWRSIGIELTTLDRNNDSLPFPIKVSSVPMPYEACRASHMDPRQGCC